MSDKPKKKNMTEKQLANLKLNSFNDREIAKKAQQKSVESRKRNKTLKEELELLLLSDERQTKISLALLQEALNGNVKAFEVIRDTIGQKPKDVIENINPPTINISGLNI